MRSVREEFLPTFEVLADDSVCRGQILLPGSFTRLLERSTSEDEGTRINVGLERFLVLFAREAKAIVVSAVFLPAVCQHLRLRATGTVGSRNSRWECHAGLPHDDTGMFDEVLMPHRRSILAGAA